MFIAEYQTNRQVLSGSRTYHDFSQFLGKVSHKVGVAAQLCKKHTVSYLTDQLLNVVSQDIPKKGYKDISAFCVEWDVDVNIIKRIAFAGVPEGDGIGGSEIIMQFEERYYDRNDIFAIDKTRQQFIVTEDPIERGGSCWEYVVKLVDNEYTRPIDLEGCQIGDTTHLITNVQPIDFHDTGYTKYQSNMEAHRTYISLHRNDIDVSQAYAANEDVFVKISDTDSKEHRLFKMTGADKVLQENFIAARNNKLLWGRTNIDKNGKPTHFDKVTNRPIISGDGIFAQIERYGHVVAFDSLMEEQFHEALDYLSAKSDEPIGNSYTCIVNTKLWGQVNDLMRAYLKNWQPTGTFLWSKATGGNVNVEGLKVGTTFKSYEVNGNTITFMVDRALDLEFQEEAFGFILDLTPDLAKGNPAMEVYTYRGCDMKKSYMSGVGGLTGTEEGEVSSPVAGSKKIIWGYAGIAVYAPYRSVIFRQHPQRLK